MGALHAGHVALVRAARRRARRVVVSIFVNPAQFAPEEDLATYPRTFDSDVAMLGKLPVELVWAPSTQVMYPPRPSEAGCNLAPASGRRWTIIRPTNYPHG
jgi:pantoate--beta-alanine ligase